MEATTHSTAAVSAGHERTSAPAADVLVVGAGPTGLMLATQLARRGVRTLIVDRHAGPARETRALGVQARTLELYAHLGIAERAIEQGKIGTGANLWSEGRWMARVPLSDAGDGVTPYPYILVLGQDDNERLLGERLRELGTSVQWNTEVVGLTQHADRVVASVRQPDGTLREIAAAWIAGCDGARSTVRTACGIEFAGAPYEHVFFVADTVATGGMVPDQVNVYLWRAGFHLFFPMRGENHWRVVGILPPELRGNRDVAFDAVVPSLRAEAGSGLAFASCSWFSTYHIHHRRAVRFRDRRALLLGDAAHVHSPVGAQGMNTGLQDAYNLGWKLALVVAGQADASLVDTYEEERVPVAQRLLATTDTGFRLVVSDSWRAGLFRTQVLARIASFAMSRKAVQRVAFRLVSQTGIQYRESALALTHDNLPAEAPRAGDRFPWLRVRRAESGEVEDLFQALDDLHFHLIVVGQPAPATDSIAFGGLLRVHTVADDAANAAALAHARMARPSYYLVRPDGYIGLAGARADAAAVASYVTERLKLRAAKAR